MRERFAKSVVMMVLILGLLVQMIFPIATASAATHTITYKDSNGTVLANITAAAGAAVTLRNYPSGAIAWVDKSTEAVQEARAVNNNAKGMGYVNYSSSDPANSSPVASSMVFTMPERDVVLNAFYGNYQNGDEPRLIQYHLELKYHDISSGYDLSYDQKYRNVNSPSGYVINLPKNNYFAPITGTATNPSNGVPQPFESGLVIKKWVADASYTGITEVPASKLYDPDQLVYVDPNNYNMIYDVMVDQSLDYITGGEVPPPVIQPPSIKPMSITPPARVTVTFAIDASAPAGAGFTYHAQGGVLHEALNSDTAVYEAFRGTTWENLIGRETGGTLPVHNDVSGYDYYYWTLDNDPNPISLGILPGDEINDDYLFTLHYVANVNVTFDIDPNAYDVDGNPVPLPDTGGFFYQDQSTSDNIYVNGTPDELEYSVKYNMTWLDYFTNNITIPTHLDVPGFSGYYWTVHGGTEHIGPSSIAMNSRLTKDYEFTLHYLQDAPEQIPLTVKFNTASYTWDGTEHSAEGFNVIRIGDVEYSLGTSGTSRVIALPEGKYLKLTGTEPTSVSETDVGTYLLFQNAAKFKVFDGDPGEGTVDTPGVQDITSAYQISVIPGGLTISPADATETPSESATPSSTASVTPTDTATPSSTASVTPSGTVTPRPTNSATPSNTATPSSTASVTPTGSVTPSPTISVPPTGTTPPEPTNSVIPSETTTPVQMVTDAQVTPGSSNQNTAVSKRLRSSKTADGNTTDVWKTMAVTTAGIMLFVWGIKRKRDKNT
ncbi:MAG: hypothetical protein ACK5MN_11555 [Lachnospiraceae bacterium]